IAGPCVMESKSHLWSVAETLQEITAELNMNFVFKCSYDKANRSSGASYRGPGLKEGLKMLGEVKKNLRLAILTDVHLPQDAGPAAEVADILQVPAFLSRQTDLILACAKTGRAVNIKKGQFLSPWEMENAVQKAIQGGNRKI